MAMRFCIDVVVTLAAFWIARKIFFYEQRESRFFFRRWNPAQRILFALCLPPLIFVWPVVLLVWLFRPRRVEQSRDLVDVDR